MNGDFYEPHVDPDFSCVDSREECLADELGCSVDVARRVLEWHEREVMEEGFVAVGMKLHALHEWVTSKDRIARNVWAGVPSRFVLGGDGGDGVPMVQRRQERFARLIAVRVLAMIWVLSPELVSGLGEGDIARRLGVTKALMSYYVTSFSKRFGVISRGMKCVASREVFAEAQRGNGNRSAKCKGGENKNSVNDIL